MDICTCDRVVVALIEQTTLYCRQLHKHPLGSTETVVSWAPPNEHLPPGSPPPRAHLHPGRRHERLVDRGEGGVEGDRSSPQPGEEAREGQRQGQLQQYCQRAIS